jgi:sRNA-binding regulator protein Hfq
MPPSRNRPEEHRRDGDRGREPRGRPKAPVVDPKIEIRERAKEMEARGLPPAMALAVAHGRMSLPQAMERLARSAEIEQLMRKHDLTRAVAAQIAKGDADLTAFLQRRRLAQHLEQHFSKSCLEEAQRTGQPLTTCLHGQRRIEAVVTAVGPYEVTLQPVDGSDALVIHKLQFKYCYLPGEWKRVRKALRRDKALGEGPREPIARPQDRYTLSDKRLFGYVERKLVLDITLLEGEILRGTVLWFGRYELGLALKGEGQVTIFRHAIAIITKNP